MLISSQLVDAYRDCIRPLYLDVMSGDLDSDRAIIYIACEINYADVEPSISECKIKAKMRWYKSLQKMSKADFQDAYNKIMKLIRQYEEELERLSLDNEYDD